MSKHRNQNLPIGLYDREKYKSERKSIQQKQDYFDFCIEQANKLKISYGDYMALKRDGRV